MKYGMVALVCLSIGCRSADFARDDQTVAPTPNPTRTDNSEVADPTDPGRDEPRNPSTVVTGDGGVLKLMPIDSQKVNTGKTSNRYSELLTVPVQVSGGNGQVRLSYTESTGSTRPYFDGQSFKWRPGVRDASSYRSEEGSHQVTITATDSANQSVQTTFSVDVLPISWRSTVIHQDSQSEMKVRFNISEALHSDRIYRHNGNYHGQGLNSRTCVSFSGGSPIVLDGDPIVESGAPPSNAQSAYEHEAYLKMNYPISQQPFDNTVFVTWVNFEAIDAGRAPADADSGILIYYAYARCRNGPEDQGACKREALRSNGMENFFYCSDYYASSNRAEELRKVYCGVAALNGITPSGC